MGHIRYTLRRRSFRAIVEVGGDGKVYVYVCVHTRTYVHGHGVNEREFHISMRTGEGKNVYFVDKF